MAPFSWPPRRPFLHVLQLGGDRWRVWNDVSLGSSPVLVGWKVAIDHARTEARALGGAEVIVRDANAGEKARGACPSSRLTPSP
jgi:hypothetical protein